MSGSLDAMIVTTVTGQELDRMATRLGGVDAMSAATTLAVSVAWWVYAQTVHREPESSDLSIDWHSPVYQSPVDTTADETVNGTVLSGSMSSVSGLLGEDDPANTRLPDLAAGLVGRIRSDSQSVTAACGQVRVRVWRDADTVTLGVAADIDERELTLVVGDVVGWPDRRIGATRPSTAQERLRRQAEWNDTAAPRLRPDVVELIAEHVSRTPEAIAVVDDRYRLTYRDLSERATVVAAELIERGIGPERVVGIAMDRSAEMVVAIVGVLMTGGAFVPVDPSWPLARRRDVIGQASVAVLVCRAGTGAGLDHHSGAESTDPRLPDLVLVDLDAQPAEGAVTTAASPVPSRPYPTGLAYIVFTSGSTGKPKGAMIRREAIVERLLWQREEILHFGETDAALFKAPLAFDISINEILLPLISGGRVVVARAGGERDPHYLLDLIARERVTFAYLVSSMLDVVLALADGSDLLDSLRHVWCGGELLTQNLFRRFRTQLQIPMYHGYGPAEATIGVSHVIYAGDEARMGPSIGSANPNTRLYVLDGELRPVVMGEPGELYAAGFLLGRGYVGQPGLTAGRYLADPFGAAGTRMYRTGDLVRRLDDGSLEFLGRIDNQVKIRGMRLELEDVEAGLAEHPDVRMPCVVLRDSRLIGYVVALQGSTATGSEIREWARSVLPEYMVPSVVIVLDAFPVTVNGKLDRRALPEPTWSAMASNRLDHRASGESDLTSGDRSSAQGTDTVRDGAGAVAEAITSVLGLDSIGPDTDFFDVGGDSLRAIAVLGALRRAGWQATVSDIFDARTPRLLAQRVQRAGGAESDTDDQPAGIVDALPIIRWMDENSRHIRGFVQAVEYRAPADLNLTDATAILAATIRAHPALNARIRTDPTLRVEIPVPDERSTIEVMDLAPQLSSAESIDVLVDRLDPTRGRVVAAGLRVGSHRARSLLMVIHHLVVDAVSWDILAEDLTAAYAARRSGALDDTGKPARDDATPVLAEGTSLRRWSELLERSVTGLRSDREYFARVLAHPDAPLADIGTVANAPVVDATVADEMVRLHELDPMSTGPLLDEVVTGFRATAEAVLLTALSLALAQWRISHRGPQTHSLIELEGHGRESRHIAGPQGREADLSRTVGWFTTLYPVLIDPGASEVDDEVALVRALKAVKDQLAVVPHRGIGYGVLRYLGSADTALTARQPQVLFNYLGRVGAPNERDFSPVGPTGQLGERRDPQQRLPRELEFNAITELGPQGPTLRTTISWVAGRIGADRIDELVVLWDSALRALARIAHRASHSAGDFALTATGTTIADQAEIDAIDGPGLVDVLPLTPLQEGLYFHSVFDGAQSSMYVEQQILRLRGSLDTDRLALAARELLRRCPELAARFATGRGGRVQMILDTACADALSFRVLDQTTEWSDEQIARIAAADRGRGFDPSHPPLMRYTVLTDGAEHVVVQTVHHLIADGWSVPIMLRELVRLYRDGAAPEHGYRLDRGFGGYLRWIAARDHRADVDRWRHELAGAIHPVVLAPGSTASAHLDEMVVHAPDLAHLENRIRSAGLRAPEVIQAAWAVVLRQLSGVSAQTDVLFGSTVSGRDAPVDGIAEAIGMFINTVPVRAAGGAPDRPARELVSALAAHHDRVRDCLHVGLPEIARVVGTSAGALFDTLVVLEIGTDHHEIDCSGTGIEIVGLDNDGAPHYPLTLVVALGASEPLRLIHDPDVVSPLRAQRVARQLSVAISMMLTDATVGEVTAAVGAQGGAGADTLATLWESSVRAHADRPALGELTAHAHTGYRWTYRDIDRTARSLADRLAAATEVTDRPARVALLLDRSVAYAHAIVAAVLAGATYVPLDPHSPRRRLELIIADAQPDIIITSPSHHQLALSLGGGGVAIVTHDSHTRHTLPGDTDTAIGHPAVGYTALGHTADGHRSPRHAHPDDAAYIIYTSGSTGTPKGVVVTHRNVVSLLHHGDAHLHTGAEDIWSLSHSFAFDFSVWELWAPLRDGALTLIVDHGLSRSAADLGAALRTARVTVVNVTPTAFGALESAGITLPDLRYVIFGGERLEPGILRAWTRRHRQASAVNMYGITETTVHVTALRMTDGVLEGKGSPIGRPLGGLRTYVLDALLRPLALGDHGILYVAGPQVSLGYLGGHGLTASRFVADPFSADGSRMYCSGDVVSLRRDGGLDYVGRVDRQLQLRGFRIESGEVETALRSADGVADAAVVVVDTRYGPRLGAVLVSESSSQAPDLVTSARRTARSSLPPQMVPTELTVVEAIPRTVNGKRDDAAIAALLTDLPEDSVEVPVPTENTGRVPGSDGDPALSVIGAVIADALDLAEVEAGADFFTLGGDSIVAIRVANRLTTKGIRITPRDIFLGRTPAGISARVAVAATAPQTPGEVSQPPVDPVPAPMLLRQQALGCPRDFVQGRVVRSPTAVTRDELRSALTGVIDAHPMLRARITGTGPAEALSVTVLGPGDRPEPVVDVIEIDDHYDGKDDDGKNYDGKDEYADRDGLFARAIERATTAIDLDSGRLITAAIVDAGRSVVLVAHHAVVDSVSWMIITDDLLGALDGRRPVAESTSFAQYCTEVLRWAYREEATATLDYWRTVVCTPPLLEQGWFGRDELDVLRVEIDPLASAVVLDDGPQALGCTTTELITGVVVAAAAQMIGQSRPVAVDVERHGRTEPGESITPSARRLECDRTVGWFTQIAPVAIHASTDPAACIANLAAALREQPDPLSYMALRYLHAGVGRTLTGGGAQLLVNYLGRGESREVVEVPEPRTPPVTPYALEANVWVAGPAPRISLQVAVARDLAGGSASPVSDVVTHAVRAAVAGLAEAITRRLDHGEQSVPPTVLQRGLLFQSQVAAAGSYHAQTVLTFDRRLDRQIIAEAFADAVVVHPAMGARFDLDAAPPRQLLPARAERVLLPVAVIDVDSQVQESQMLAADRVRPLPLETAPVARATVLRRAGRGDILVFSYHLVLLDGWSRARFLRTFLDRIQLREMAVEKGTPVPRPQPARPGFAEVARLLAARDHRADVQFWADRLSGLAAPTLVAEAPGIGASGPRSNSTQALPRQLYRRLSAGQSAAITDAVRAHSVTLSAMVSVAMALTLQTATGEPDVVFGLSVSGRDTLDLNGSDDHDIDRSAMDSVVGVLLNTVPIRIRLDAGRSVSEALRRIHSERAESMPHDGADLGEIQQVIQVPELFDSLVVIQNFLDPVAAQRTRERHGILAESAEDSTHFPLTWVFTPGEELALKLEYRAELVEESAAAALADTAMAALCALGDAAPGWTLASLPLPPPSVAPTADPAALAAAQRPRLVRTVIDEFAEVARRDGDRTALVCGSLRWTFAELAQRCAALAGRLAAQGVGNTATVAVAVPRSAEVVVAILGVLWSGARYVPLDLEHPDERLRTICADCDPDVVVVSDESMHRMTTIVAADRILPVTAGDGVTVPALQSPQARVDDDAYVIYTSGSTGVPKGVVIAHAGLHNMLINHRRKIFAPAVRAAGRRFRIAHAISFAFDMSWEELLWLAEGHEVHICGEELRRDAPALARYVDQARIDVVNVTPGQADQLLAEGLLDRGRHIPPLVLLGGEAVSVQLWNRLRDNEKTRGYNLYGPTEYTINTLGVGTDESSDPVVGTPVDNTEVMILDRWLRPVPQGVPGELYVTGIGLARGYLHRGAQTAAAMVACPLGLPGQRMYRTGDLVRRRSDGLIDYLGRTDDQVKIRGHRVDPGEVSSVVRRVFADQLQAVVTVPVGGELCCHLVAETGDPAGLMRAVRDRLRTELPDYLVPLRYSVHDQMPLTINGKVDLLALGSGSMIDPGGRALSGETELLVAELMAQALDCDDFDSDVDFFSVGGHSMSAVRLAALLRGEFGRPVSVKDVYEHRSVSALAASLA